jgi:hypothetical protein
VYGDQRMEETPRGIDGMICIVYGNDQRLCEMIVRLQVPDRIAVHPLTNGMTKSTTCCTDHLIRPCASWPFGAASFVEVVQLVQQS